MPILPPRNETPAIADKMYATADIKGPQPSRPSLDFVTLLQLLQIFIDYKLILFDIKTLLIFSIDLTWYQNLVHFQ